MLIAHSPGHGHNGDLGCQHNGIIEARLVMDFARSIRDGIGWAQHLLLRDSEIGRPESERAAIAKRDGAEFVLLHHINANDKPDCRGLMAFYTPHDDVAYEVATMIARSAPMPLWRGGAATVATDANWPRVLWCLQHYQKLGLSAVLVEWGFSTNAGDAEALKSLALRPAIVACAAAGIGQAMHSRMEAA